MLLDGGEAPTIPEMEATDRLASNLKMTTTLRQQQLLHHTQQQHLLLHQLQLQQRRKLRTTLRQPAPLRDNPIASTSVCRAAKASSHHRGRAVNASTATGKSDRSRWPSCTRVHGVIVEGSTIDAAALHRLMGAIYIARRDAERKRCNLPPPMHAWTAAASVTAERHEFDFSRLPDAPPRWAYGDRMMRALKGWLTALRWTAGEVSNIEMAVDFEVFTGVNVPGPPDGSSVPVNQRGKTLWTMLSALSRICEDLQLPPLLPAERVTRVGCLRTLGAPMVWGGLSRRPQFAGGLETSRVIEACLPRAVYTTGIPDSNWGGDVFPQYDVEQRFLRARQWDTPAPAPARPTRPVPVPASRADPSLRTQSVCDACAKQKCSLCTSMRRNYSLTVNQCCQVHHGPDDSLKVQCCRTHHLTRCGTCPNAATCCGYGHHKAIPISDHTSEEDNEEDQSCNSPATTEVDGPEHEDTCEPTALAPADELLRSDGGQPPPVAPTAQVRKRNAPGSPASPATMRSRRQRRRTAANGIPANYTDNRNNDVNMASQADPPSLNCNRRKRAAECKKSSSSLSFSTDTPDPSPSRVLPPRRRRRSDPVGVT